MALVVGAVKASEAERSSIDFRSGIFFQWFSIIFIPSATFISLLSELPLYDGFDVFQFITMVFFFYYYFHRHEKADGMVNQADYVNMYLVAVIWSLMAIHYLRNPFAIMNNSRTVFLDLGILSLVIGGGLGLKFERPNV